MKYKIKEKKCFVCNEIICSLCEYHSHYIATKPKGAPYRWKEIPEVTCSDNCTEKSRELIAKKYNKKLCEVR